MTLNDVCYDGQNKATEGAVLQVLNKVHVYRRDFICIFCLW